MTRLEAACLAVLGAVFLAVHAPLLSRVPAGQDEDWYGVVGASILKSGVPHVPYIASDDPASVCHGVDRALFTLPPLGFYWQALIERASGPGLAGARLASVLSALGAMVIVFVLGRQWLADGRASAIAAGAFLFSRFTLFPSTSARPDMTAAALGLASLAAAVRWGRSPGRSRGWLVASGLFAGAGLITHPFAVVPAVQSAAIVALEPGRRWTRRALDVTVFAAAALLVASAWAPLIARHPDLFATQFGGNVARRAGPNLVETASGPWSAIGPRFRGLLDYVGPLQALVLTAATAGTFAFGLGPPSFRRHVLASWLLLILFEGRHPTLSYYVYPAALSSLSIGALAASTSRRLATVLRSERAAISLVVVMLALAWLPGSGVRTLYAHATHWRDPGYDVRRFARGIAADIPPDALLASDASLAPSLHFAGLRVVDAFIEPDPSIRLYDVRDKPFDYAVFTREGLRLVRPRCPDLVLLKCYGDSHDSFSLYAELFARRAPSAPPH
jgi:4-amino-4-deoxy-L-arabinose transferase-like glycosyltransferase